MNYLEFSNYVELNPFIGKQEQCGKDINYWNADYWTIEVARCLYYKEKYTIPKKFELNKNCDVNRIKKDANIKLSMKEHLNSIEEDVLLVCEVGRGLDIIVANTVKKWKKIYCYDHVDYSKYLNIFYNVCFLKSSTSIFNPEIIKEKAVMLMNNSIYRDLGRFKINNLIHGIIDGKLKW